MKLPVSENTAPPAPALARGLEVLRFLEDGCWRTLEQIARQLEVPKASAYRLLTTLVQQGVAAKGPDKRYQALWVLRPRDAVSLWYELLGKTLRDLAEETGCTAEWYEPDRMGMILCLQRQGSAEVNVVARPGYTRAWADELDCVATLGYAFAGQAPDLPELIKVYQQNGESGVIDAAAARERIGTARQSDEAYDSCFNSNAIRRCARAVRFPGTNFRGVLALAEAFNFKETSKPRDLLQHLQQATENLKHEP